MSEQPLDKWPDDSEAEAHESICEPETKLKTISAGELVNSIFPQSEDVVDGILPQKGRLIISAPAKLGKTRFVLGLAIGLATGTNVMGMSIARPRCVLYLQAELGEVSLQKRLRKMLASCQVDERLLNENFHFCNDPRLKLTSAEDVQNIRELVERHKPEVIVFDPLYKYNNGDESNVRDMTRFFDPLDRMIEELGVSILIVHHHGKGRGENLSTPAHHNRGSSTIADWADSLLTLTFEDPEAGVVRMAFTLRNAEEPLPKAFQRNSETLWFDPLEDYEFKGRVQRLKVSAEDVSETLGPGRAVAYGKLVDELVEKFEASERTAKEAIRRATEAGSISKNEAGRYEVQGATPL